MTLVGIMAAGAEAVAAPGAISQEEHVDLLELAQEVGAVLEWNPMRQLGVLASDHHQVALRVGTPWVLVDRAKPLFVGDIVRSAGAVLLTAPGAAQLRRLLSGADDAPVHRIGAILIDPGHGGKDPGASATHNFGDRTVTLREKEIVLETSLALHRLLSVRYPEKRVVLTRSDDRYLTLEQRTEMANGLLSETGAAVIFIAVHANASLSKVARGFEVWYLPENYRRDVILPDSSAAKSPKLAPILNTVQEEEFSRDSQLLAQTIVDHFQHRVGDRSINRGVREESWFVVRNAKMPAVLIELGFATNRREAALLAAPDYLHTLAEAIYSAVTAFVTMFEESDSG